MLGINAYGNNIESADHRGAWHPTTKQQRKKKIYVVRSFSHWLELPSLVSVGFGRFLSTEESIQRSISTVLLPPFIVSPCPASCRTEEMCVAEEKEDSKMAMKTIALVPQPDDSLFVHRSAS